MIIQNIISRYFIKLKLSRYKLYLIDLNTQDSKWMTKAYQVEHSRYKLYLIDLNTQDSKWMTKAYQVGHSRYKLYLISLCYKRRSHPLDKKCG